MIGSTRHEHTQRGYILLPVVLALTLLAAIAWLINREGAIHADMVTATTEAVMAEQVARAGLAHATWGANNSDCAGDMALPTLPFGEGGNDSYSATVTTPGGGTSAATLSVDQDAWFRSDQPDVNNSSNADMHLRLEDAGTEVALYRFDLSSLPAGARINSASAWFYVVNSGPGGGAFPEGALTIHNVNTDWAETDPTWNTMNTAFGNEILAVIPAQPQDDVWVEVNLTSQVQAWVNGADPNFGIMIRPTVDGTHGKLVSKEGASSLRPRLEVVIGTAPPSPATIAATGILENGNTRSVTRTGVPLYQPMSHFLLQPGSEGKDAKIYSWKKTWNYGANTSLDVTGGSGSTYHSLLQFMLGSLPEGAKIQSAILALYQKSNGAWGGPVGVRRITSDWVEGAQNQGFGPGVNWNEHDTGILWTSPGGDLGTTTIASNTIPGGAIGWFSWDITELVNGWVSGSYENNGLALVPESGSTDTYFHSSDAADPPLRPKLILTFACECGSPCLMPQGNSNLLLVTAGITPNPSEMKLITLLESWGYTVDSIDDDSPQADFNTRAGLNDVAFIPGTIDKLKVDNKLTNAPIGVVSAHGEMNDKLGFASSSAWSVGSGLDVIDASHFITAPFPAGPLEIFSAAMEGLTLSGTGAAGLQTLADWGGAGSLSVLEKGAALGGEHVGAFAAGRRVMLPLGREGKFNWDYLNNNGRLIVQRALQWGIGDLDDLPFIYRDEFNSFACTGDDYSGSDAPRDWSPWPWSEIGEATDSCGNNVKLVNDLGSTRLRIDAAGRGIERQADLSAFPTAWLHFDYRRVNFAATTDALTVWASADGGTGWTEVGRFIGPVNDVTYQGASIDISAYTSTGTMIRFMEETAGGSKVVYIDNVQIDTLAPTGLQTILFVVPDATALGTQDAVKKTLMESWGYTVAPFTAAATQADYDAAVATADVVYISEEIQPSNTQGKLKDAAIGIVNEEADLVQAFEIASNWSNDNETDTDIVDATHYITSVFGSGIIVLASGDTDLIQLTGSPASGVNTLSETSAKESLVTVSTGGLLNDGSTAAGRRVQLPWGGTGFDINLLTADGQTVMRRSIEWAGGAGADTGGGGGGGGGSSCVGSYFRDEFNLESYAENDGTLNWGGDWVEGGETTDPTGNEIRIENDISDFQLRLKKDSRSVTRPLDLSSYSSATLTFDSRRDGLGDPADDYLIIEATSDGSNWYEVGRLDGAGTDPGYLPNSIDITAYISNLSAIRFATSSTNDKNALYFFDDIEVCVN